MTDQDVWTAAVKFVASVTGLVTIKAYQAGARPDAPYVMVNLTGTAEVREHAATTEYTDTGVQNPAGENEISAAPVIETEWQFSVHAYGDNPTGLLRPLRSAAQVSQTWEPHFPALTIFDVSQIRRVPEMVKARWEPRAQMDLFIRGLTRDGFVIDVIDQATVDFSAELAYREAYYLDFVTGNYRIYPINELPDGVEYPPHLFSRSVTVCAD